MIHIMKLNSKPFAQMVAGSKNIEYRLNDEKRQKIKVGDTIFFTNVEDDNQLEVKVINIINAHTFTELQTKLINKGYLDSYNDFEPASMLKYYSKDDEYKYGVVGICINILNKEEEKDFYYAKYNEPSYVTVARYILEKWIENKEDVRICGTALCKNEKIMSHKIRRVFSKDMSDSMAYYIKMLEGETSVEEYESAVKGFRNITKKDTEAALKFACRLQYKIYGVYKKGFIYNDSN